MRRLSLKLDYVINKNADRGAQRPVLIARFRSTVVLMSAIQLRNRRRRSHFLICVRLDASFPTAMSRVRRTAVLLSGDETKPDAANEDNGQRLSLIAGFDAQSRPRRPVEDILQIRGPFPASPVVHCNNRRMASSLRLSFIDTFANVSPQMFPSGPFARHMRDIFNSAKT
jgi:hypothetical protein